MSECEGLSQSYALIELSRPLTFVDSIITLTVVTYAHVCMPRVITS